MSKVLSRRVTASSTAFGSLKSTQSTSMPYFAKLSICASERTATTMSSALIRVELRALKSAMREPPLEANQLEVVFHDSSSYM